MAAVSVPAFQVEEEDEFDDTAHVDDSVPFDAGEPWFPANEVSVDPIFSNGLASDLPKLPALMPSKFTQFAFRMPRHIEKGPDDETEEEFNARLKKIIKPGEDMFFENFDFTQRPYMRRIYDTPARRLLLKCARQVEKSTLLGNISLCYMCLIPSYKVLYVNSSATQAKTFSNDRVKEPIETSPILRQFTTAMLSQNILEKQFVNRSKLTMRYAFLNADRTRGIPAYDLKIDEFQDILSSNIPVIEQCTAHAPPKWKRFTYAGTPKSLDNNIEEYWANRSTQCEWVVPHDCKGGDTGKHWNILGEANIGKHSLICNNPKCGKPIHPLTEGAQWGAMANFDKKIIFEGYRIPQLMVPWKPWKEILHDYEHYPRDKFYNEVLGISYDSGLRPLTRDHIKECCNPRLSFADLEKQRSKAFSQPFFMGIDWGTGENSYTVVTLATYVDMKFRVLFMHRFEGEESDPPRQLEKLCELIEYFNVQIIGADYGGGFDRNDHLTRKFGPNRLMKFQYLARGQKKVAYDPKLGRFKVARTEVMSDIFNAIKRGNCFEFPRWEEFEKPFAQDMLNIHSEYNEKLKMIQYSHNQDKPDDSFHSMLYAFLASMSVIPRPDIIVPKREVGGRPVAGNVGTTNQG